MRVAIIGNSGSGKSTLAQQLADTHSLDVLDLDTIAWDPQQATVMRPAESALSDVHDFCADRDSWVVEGCYASLIQGTFVYEPALWFLDPGSAQCVSNCRSRPWEPHKYASKEEQDEKLPFLIQWVTDYYARDGDMSLSAHKELYAGYTGVKHWIKSMPPNA